MFSPWIKRKSLKRPLKSKRLLVDGERPSLIMLLSLSGLLVAAGVFVVQRSWALNEQLQLAPTPMATPSESPSPSPDRIGEPQER